LFGNYQKFQTAPSLCAIRRERRDNQGIQAYRSKEASPFGSGGRMREIMRFNKQPQ
jgi:hypothetical protein